ncbi:hypothetical protein ACFY00_18495 [Kitasatospora sp. NPDC001540]|uniref:hypothetical protein n=1 Tax=Kitasatospora sp. NPDC001540 TaxID=3364014 RepID=UPI0036C7A0A2
MSYSLYLLRFVGGAAAELDAARFLELTAPHLPPAGREDAYSALVLPDGGTVGLHHPAEPGAGLRCVTAHRLERGDPTALFLRLAAALDAAVVLQEGVALLLREDARRDLPPELRETAVVIEPTERALQAVLARI